MAHGEALLLRGWMHCFRLSETKGFAEKLDGWVRRHLRVILWRQWKKPGTRHRRLRALGLEDDRARISAGHGHGACFDSGASHLHSALSAKALAAMGLSSLLEPLQTAQARRPV